MNIHKTITAILVTRRHMKLYKNLSTIVDSKSSTYFIFMCSKCDTYHYHRYI